MRIPNNARRAPLPSENKDATKYDKRVITTGIVKKIPVVRSRRIQRVIRELTPKIKGTVIPQNGGSLFGQGYAINSVIQWHDRSVLESAPMIVRNDPTEPQTGTNHAAERPVDGFGCIPKIILTRTHRLEYQYLRE
jgi:hypothetical protein